MNSMFFSTRLFNPESMGGSSSETTEVPSTPTPEVAPAKTSEILTTEQEQSLTSILGNKNKHEAQEHLTELEKSKSLLPSDSHAIILKKNADGKMQIFVAERKLYKEIPGQKAGEQKPDVKEAAKKKVAGEQWKLTRDFLSITMFTPELSADGKVVSRQSKIDNLEIAKGDIIVPINLLTEDPIKVKALGTSEETRGGLAGLLAQFDSYTKPDPSNGGKSWLENMFGDEEGKFFGGIVNMIKNFFFRPTDFTLDSTVQDPQNLYNTRQESAQLLREKCEKLFAKANGSEAPKQEVHTTSEQSETEKQQVRTTSEKTSTVAHMEAKGGANTPEKQKEFAETRKVLSDKIRELSAGASNIMDVFEQLKTFIKEHSGNAQLKYYYDTWVRRITHPETPLTEAEKKVIGSTGVLETERAALQSISTNLSVKKAEVPMKNTYQAVTALTSQPYAIIMHHVTKAPTDGSRSFHSVIKKDGSLELHYAAGDLVDGFTRDDAVNAIQKTHDALLGNKETGSPSAVENTTSFWKQLTKRSDARSQIDIEDQRLSDQNVFKNMPATNRPLINGLNYHLAIEEAETPDAINKQKATLKALDTYFGMVNPGQGSGPRHILINTLTAWNAPTPSSPETQTNSTQQEENKSVNQEIIASAKIPMNGTK